MGAHYRRGEVEFGRIVGFSDGIFGIAMTLLVAGIAVPEVARQDLGRALADNAGDIFSFGRSFAVIGFLWARAPRLFRLLTHMDDRLMRINLAHLGLIAFMPFPTALLGRYDGDLVAVAVYAVVLAIAGVTGAVMFRHARGIGALTRPMPDGVYRHLHADEPRPRVGLPRLDPGGARAAGRLDADVDRDLPLAVARPARRSRRGAVGSARRWRPRTRAAGRVGR